MWLPHISLRHVRTPLPLLTVRMEPAASQPPVPVVPRAKPVTAHPAPPARIAPKPAVPQVSLVNQIASSVAASPEAPLPPAPAPAPAASAEAPPVADGSLNRSKANIPALPLHAQLRFAVYLDGSGFSIGDLFQELSIKEGRYTLLAELEKSGLASWFNSSQLTQSSRGAMAGNGDLVPEEFREEATNAHGVHHLYDATFDWPARKLHLGDGAESTPPLGAQDMLSFQYQLSQYSFNTEIISLPITDGQKLVNIRLEVGAMEDITTPMGTLRALHLRTLHDEGVPSMEIWLGADYHMLPVKFQKQDAGGKVSEELIIKEIRVSDDQPGK